ncbi:MAG TPA: glycosyltransferase family 10 [Hymenobacter sp.]|jgi:hypothetical protein|uniref:glycosyltransferase family 10 domain-containing protein n=1 Tax=Hymenobacter sp. TaxID=1898978 RepID=UPI002ED8E346
MIKATLYVLHEPDFLDFIGNRIFSDLPVSGIKNYGYMFAAIRRQLAIHDIDLATQDIHPPEDSKIIIAVDQVAFFQNYKRNEGQVLYLILNEPATYFPNVWKKENHVVFDRVFTYDYTLVDGIKYIHHYFAIDLNDYPAHSEVSESQFNERKLLVLMAGMFQLTKPKQGSGSLLYKRYQTLLWFGKHMPQQFDFYSRTIMANFGSFKGLGILQRILPPGITNYLVKTVAARRRRVVEALSRGPVPPLEKLSVISSYKFVVCYENTSVPGYISEKIFDCLFAGCVPIYLGEPDIEKFVPAECYIDRRSFKTEKELSIFLMQMPYSVYSQYIAAAKKFLSCIDSYKFGVEENAWRVSKVVIDDFVKDK